MNLLEVRNLKVHFPVRHGIFGRVRDHVKAVDGVSFTVGRGETRLNPRTLSTWIARGLAFFCPGVNKMEGEAATKDGRFLPTQVERGRGVC